MRETRKIAITSSIGGSGKTTTAVNLALSLAIEGKKVLLVDLNEQGEVGQVADYFGYDKELMPLSFYDFVFNKDYEAIRKVRDNLHLIRGGYDLELLNLKLQVVRVKYGERGYKYTKIYETFSEIFEPIEDRFDYIIFDTISYWGMFTINTLMYVDEIIIPVNLEHDNYRSLRDFVTVKIEAVQSNRIVPLKLSHILPICYDTRTDSSMSRYYGLKQLFTDVIQKRKDNIGNYDDTTICQPLPYNTRLNKCYRCEQELFRYLEDHRVVKEYREFAKTVAGIKSNIFEAAQI
jgi:chromosome partitioning protein